MKSREQFLTSLGGAAALALIPHRGTAQAAPARRIDVHRHVSPPFYQNAIKGLYTHPFPAPLADWTPESCLADMDAGGIETGILSMPARPGMVFGDPVAARKLCRDSNVYMGQLRRAHPGRFGFFAALPLPDIEGSLIELAYALDTLKADGIGAWSSYGTKYLGDPIFEPLWTELERRKATVFTHPTDAACCVNPVPVMSETIVEFAADTTRTIGSLVFSGTAAKFPSIAFIFSHGGGNMPYVIDRFHNQMDSPKSAALVPNGVESALRKFYYDTAFASAAAPMAALTKLIPISQIVFGSDYPYNPGAKTVAELEGSGIAPSALNAIGRDNALPLLRK